MSQVLFLKILGLIAGLAKGFCQQYVGYILTKKRFVNLVPRAKTKITVEPVSNGPVLSGHPLLSGQLLKSRFLAHTNAVFVTCIRRPPCSSPMFVFLCYFYLYLAATLEWKLSHMHSTMDNRNCRWQCRQSTTCSTTKVSNSEAPNARVPLVSVAVILTLFLF